VNGFAGKYLSRSEEEESDTTQNLLYLQQGKNWTLQHTVNNSTKSISSGEYQGIYSITSTDNHHRLSGITEYPTFKKLHSVRQTHPPKHRQEFFAEVIKSVEGFIEGKFSADKKVLKFRVHFGVLCDEENWVLEHYFSPQKILVERQ